MADTLPNKMILPSRDTIRDKYLRDYKIRNPNGFQADGITPAFVDTTPGSPSYVDAALLADAQMPLYANVKVLGEYVNLDNRTFDDLIELGHELGLDPVPLPATPATGFVQLTTSIGGGSIPAGRELKTTSGTRYQSIFAGTYTNGQFLAITAVDTGPTTDLPVGTVLQFTSPPIGIAPTVTVVADSAGNGITGGQDAETREGLVERIRDKQGNPPASGNDAAYQDFVQKQKGLSVQKCFTYPAVLGPGTTCIAATMRPAQPGGNRLPTGTDIALLQQALAGAFPVDDQPPVATGFAQPINLMLGVTWTGNSSWTDAIPWPIFSAASPIQIQSATPTATAFRVHSGSVPFADPIAGQNIAIWDPVSGAFRRKQVLTVTVVLATFTWDLTLDPTIGGSDASFVPDTGDFLSPWSDSLNLLVPSILSFFDNVGPGEMVASPFDIGGRRQKRQPESPASWPSQITARILGPLYALPDVDTITVKSPALPQTTTVGVPGVSFNMLTLGEFGVYPT